MEFDDVHENSFSGSGAPIFGAIFMANRSTKKECLKRRLFGLPPPQANFVMKVKSGMILFLFEYEERKLYGVFQASSDGAMNIVPHAFRSSGKHFPAQIPFKSIWCCKPLFERDFRSAIKDNYYTSNKFNLGLSKDQVFKLLLLFNSRKVQKCKSPLPRDKFITHSSGSGRVGVFDEREHTPSDSDSGNVRLLKDNAPVNLGRFSDLSKSNLHCSNVSDKCFVGQHGLSYVEQYSVKQDSPNIHCSSSLGAVRDEYDNNQCRSPYTPDINSVWLGGDSSSVDIDVKNSPHAFTVYSKSSADGFLPIIRSQVIPFHIKEENLSLPSIRSGRMDATCLEDYIPLEPENHFEHIPQPLSPRFKNVNPVKLEDYKGPTFPETSLGTISFSRHALFAREDMAPSLGPGKDPSYVPEHHCPANLQEPPYSTYWPSGAAASFESQLQASVPPLDSQSMKSYGKLEQNKPIKVETDEYGFGLQSDIHNQRTSVFSRLSVRKEIPIHDGDYEGNKDEVDMSVNQVMKMLDQSEKMWRKSTKRSQQHIENDAHGCSNSKNTQNEWKDVPLACEEPQCQDVIIEEPTMNFKRRSKIRKQQCEIGGYREESDGLTGTLSRKRRKLLRPSFNSGGTQDKGIISDTHPSENELPPEIIERNGGNIKALINCNGIEGNGKESSQNFGLEIVVHPVSLKHNCGRTEICEGGRSETLVNSNGHACNEKESSQNSTVQVVVHPICFEPNGKTESLSNNSQDFKVMVEAVIQELTAIKDHSSRQDASRYAQTCCKHDDGKIIEVSGSRALVKANASPVCEGNKELDNNQANS